MVRKPDPPEMPPMTDAQRRANWWHYHKVPILIAVLAIAAVCFAVWERVNRDAPDCSVAMVVRFTPANDEIAALQTALGRVCPDINGDGKVSVALNVIRIDYLSTDLDDAAVMDMTANVDKLNSDFYTRQSGIFLLDDPASFQAAHGALSYLDSSAPPEGASDWENMTVPWSRCEAVKEVSFRAGDPGSLWFARRAVWDDEDRQAFALVSHVLLFAPAAGLIGGLIAGPGLCGLADTILRSLRDEPGFWWHTYKRAWKRNVKSALLPGAVGGALLSTQLFLLFHAGALHLSIAAGAGLTAGILLVLGLPLYLWPQLALMDLTFLQLLKNAGLLFLGQLPRSIAALVILAGYLGLVLRFFTLAVSLLPFLNLWLPAVPAVFLIYPGINENFRIEETLHGN